MDAALVGARFAHFAATMTLCGATFFAAVLAPASVRPDLSPWLRRLTAPLALLSLGSALAWFCFVAQDMGDDGFGTDTLRDVALDTSFGRIWLGRLALLALLLVSSLRPDRGWRAPALLAALATASLGLVGHAAMQEGALGAAHRANHAGHLLVTSGWLGGLPPFLVCLIRFARDPTRRDALAAMMRFSMVGHGAVAAVFATGAFDILLTSGALPWPPDTPYRQGLCLKIAIVCAMTALALFNRYVLAPRIGRSPAAVRALAAGAFAEFALALAAVALVSGFATLDPR